MATNLSIDPELSEFALEVSGERTKKADVALALREFESRRWANENREAINAFNEEIEARGVWSEGICRW